MLSSYSDFENGRGGGTADGEVMCGFLGIMELVGDFFAVDDGNVGVLRVRFIY